MATDYYVRRVDQSLFKGQHTHGEQVLLEQEAAYHIKGTPNQPDENGYGSYTWFEGIPFPRKCAYDQDFLAYANIMKRLTMSLIRLPMSWEVTSAINVVNILPDKVQEKLFKKLRNRFKNYLKRKVVLDTITNFLFEWERTGRFVMSPALWKDEKRWCVTVRELDAFIEIFLDNLGITKLVYGNKKLTHCVAEVAGSLIEHDDSYRFRAQDIFGLINKQWLLDDPAAEVTRVLQIYKKREKGGIEDKFDAIVKGLNLIFKIPEIKTAFISAVQGVDFEKLSLDKADRYWAYKKSNYDFDGKNWDQRSFYFNQLHGFSPPPFKLI